MNSLKMPPETFDIEVVSGIKMTVRRVTSQDMAVAQAAAQQTIDRLQESAAVCADAGVACSDIDFEDDAVRCGLLHEQTIMELGKRHIISWSGVETKDGAPAEVSAETVRSVLEMWPVGEFFFRQVTSWHMEQLSAKKEYGAGAGGISATTPVPNIAADAAGTDFPARRGWRGRMATIARMLKMRRAANRKLLPGT